MASNRKASERTWWEQAIIYQVAVVSFQDSNGDGRGDLGGLIERIDYLTSLGVDAVWLTPIFRSPMRDFGYDVSDFCSIDPVYGSFGDFERLVALLHERNLKLILDFVPNHTSDQHKWFLESRSSRRSPKRDWYVWADPDCNGGPPNNWLSRFGGSAWQWDEATAQYYYHSFLVEQPDLNWRNPEVRQAMADVLRFWMKRGVDGFRVDASAVLAEDDLLRDDPPDPEADESTPPPQRLKRIFTDDRPETMRYLEELRRVIDEYDGRMLCGEVQGKTERIGHFYGSEHPRLHLPLNFALIDSAWTAVALQAEIDAYLNAVPDDAWPVWVVGGHDKNRIASKIGQEQARILAMLLMTLRGTPFFFAGDEIGMEQVPVPSDRIDDPFEKLVPGYGLNRDPERSPFRWDSGTYGGFTTGKPWLPMGDDIADRNVDMQMQDARSLLHLYRSLIALRKAEPALTKGMQTPLRSHNDIFAYKRSHADDDYLVALNMTEQPRRFHFNGDAELLLSTYLDGEKKQFQAPFLLRPDEGVILKLRS
jgi:alpha-glucosidase